MSKFSLNTKLEKLSVLLSFLFFTAAFFGIVSSKLYGYLDLKNERVLIPAPKGLHYIDFGFSEVMSDSLWLRAIQDIDYCDQKIAQNICQEKGWLFTILDSATDLSPKFEILYNAGGLALSVLVSDVEGATIIFDKGVRAFPKKWDLTYRAGYHAMYEEKNHVKAAEYLILSARHGGPSWLYGLAQRLYLREGQRELGIATLNELKKHPEDNEKLISRLEKRMVDFDRETEQLAQSNKNNPPTQH